MLLTNNNATIVSSVEVNSRYSQDKNNKITLIESHKSGCYTGKGCTQPSSHQLLSHSTTKTDLHGDFGKDTQELQKIKVWQVSQSQQWQLRDVALLPQNSVRCVGAHKQSGISDSAWP